MPENSNYLLDELVDASGRTMGEALEQDRVAKDTNKRLSDIINARGLTPAQRAMFSAAMNRSLGLQAEQAGSGLGRRSAAQGISGTGLANAGLGQIQSGLLSAQQQGEGDLNQKSLDLYMNALNQILGINERQKDRNLQMQQMEDSKTGLGGLLGGLAGTFFGPVGGALGSKLGDKLFG